MVSRGGPEASSPMSEEPRTQPNPEDGQPEAEAADAVMSADPRSGDELDGDPPNETDHANYFCEYAYLYHQMDMLEDSHRTGSYYNAIMWNRSCFEGKVVLDVGAGTCILSIMAARAGASQVFAVEATDMAGRGRRLVESNGLSSTIRVLQGTVESVTLPCKVDVIVSEWMGYFLLRESMLDSVLVARDKFLKPGGAMFPSHCALYLAPTGQVKALREKWQTWEGEKQHWATFNSDMKKWYEADFSCVQQDFMREQRKYYLQTGAFATLTPKHLCGPGRPLLELDLLKTKVGDLVEPSEALTCSMRIARDGPVEGFAGFFDAFFRGSQSNPVDKEVTLTTAPTVGVASHWGQQLFGFYPPLAAKRGDTLECALFVRRQERNHRLLRLETKFTLYGAQSDGQRVAKDEREENYFVD
uniref:type I protein arginine methyltransferase n=1 Tax=Alexandrium monilatum TaxID=311494 RepID=A0A7S4PVY9_9DINO